MPTEEFTPGSRPLVEEMPSSGGAPASESGNTFVAAAPYGESAGTRQASVTKSADPAGANAPQEPEPVPGVSGAVPDEVAGSLPPRGIEALGPTTPSGVGSPGPAPETPTPMSPGDVGTSGSTPSSGSGFSVPTSQSGAGASVAFSPSGFEGSAPTPAEMVPAVEPASPSDERRRRWAVWIAVAALLLVGAAGVGGYAYAAHYEDIAVPGTTVAGVDVTGMSRDDIIATINDRAVNANVVISGDVSTTATLADLGTTIDAEATADAVMARGASVPGRFAALLSSGKIPVVTTTDDSTAAAYATSLIPEDQAVARNAGIALDDEGTGFVVTPGAEGTSVDSAALKEAATTAATSLSTASVSVAYEVKSPAVSDADAQSVADQANEWISQDVSVTAPAGKSGVAGESTTIEETTYTADDSTKASWITVTSSETEAPTISVDNSKVSEWVAAQVKDVDEEPVTGKRNVNSQGKEVAVSVEAVDGREVTNADTISDAIVQTLSSGKPYSGTFETKEIKATWEERKIAAGAENLPYQATDGEKWIDINLSNKTVTAYEGATVVHGPVSVVDGAAATPTVTGTYHVYLQHESQTMRGENADGSNYETEGVPWITYFYQGYALHGAPWRTSFGYSGSHGCLNMPVGEAQWFFNWAEIGTTVASHY